MSMIIIFFDTKVPPPHEKVWAEGRRLQAGRPPRGDRSEQASERPDGHMSLARWPVDPLDRLRKGRQMGEQPDGDTPDGLAGWRAGWRAGRQAGMQAGGRATVFAAMPLKNPTAPAEDLEQGA